MQKGCRLPGLPQRIATKYYIYVHICTFDGIQIDKTDKYKQKLKDKYKGATRCKKDGIICLLLLNYILISSGQGKIRSLWAYLGDVCLHFFRKPYKLKLKLLQKSIPRSQRRGKHWGKLGKIPPLIRVKFIKVCSK